MLKQIEKLQWEDFDETKVKINELIEVVNEQSKIIDDLKFRNNCGL